MYQIKRCRECGKKVNIHKKIIEGRSHFEIKDRCEHIPEKNMKSTDVKRYCE